MPTPSIHTWSPEAILAALSLIPLFIAWTLGFFTSRPEPTPSFAVGNQLEDHLDHESDDVLLEPLVRLARTASSEELHTLALGLRHIPVEEAAPLLRHFMGSQDPELSLFSQSTLQQGREKLQSLFNRLRNHKQAHDPRIAASLLETGLRLSSPALMTPDERTSHLKHLGRKAQEYLTSCPPTPRLLAACSQAFLASGDVNRADEMVQKLAADSELKSSLSPSVKMAAHCHQIAKACKDSASSDA